MDSSPCKNLNCLWRWREALFGLFMSASGMIIAVGQIGVMATIGTSVAIVGTLIIFAGIQRTRFRAQSDGPGLVQVSEGLVTYYGREDGGSICIDALESVHLDPTSRPASWVLKEVGGAPVRIPTKADGAEKLFDVFTTLQGIRTQNVMAKLRANPQDQLMIWHQDQRQLH